jgi:hypothetical protein
MARAVVSPAVMASLERGNKPVGVVPLTSIAPLGLDRIVVYPGFTPGALFSRRFAAFAQRKSPTRSHFHPPRTDVFGARTYHAPTGTLAAHAIAGAPTFTKPSPRRAPLPISRRHPALSARRLHRRNPDSAILYAREHRGNLPAWRRTCVRNR